MQNDLIELADKSRWPLFVPAGQFLGYSLAGTFAASVILESSTDNDTWSTENTFTGSTSGGLAPVADTYYRFRVSAYTSGTVNSDLYRAADISGRRRMVPISVDFVYDFAVHGGANPTNALLTPSREVPAGTYFTDFFRRTITPFVCPGANVGFTFTGGTFNIEAGSDATALAKGDIAQGPTLFIGGSVEVYFHNQGAVVTAGKAQLTLNGFTPEV